MPSPQTQLVRDLKAQVVDLLDQLKEAQVRETELIRRLAAMQRALG